MSALSVSGLRVSYGAVAVLHEVSLEVRPGEIVCVIGANGAGKTTLLKTIAGVLRLAAGRVVADGSGLFQPDVGIAADGKALLLAIETVLPEPTLRTR